MITRTVAVLAFALVATAACGSKSKPAPTTTPEPATTIDPASLGTACADDGTCPAGLTCAKYFGIAGPSGPEFSSCEVPCASGEACPTGTACTTIADGPGAVCRATETGEQPPVGE